MYMEAFRNVCEMYKDDECTKEPFHRKIFYRCLSWIDDEDRIFLVLTGPRKAGKTVCLCQLEGYKGAQYINFKDIANVDERNSIIEDTIVKATDGIYLLDEITYLTGYMNQLSTICTSISDNKAKGIKDERKIIITGSHSYAIRNAANLAFSVMADYYQISFIDFEEWLVFRGRMKNYGDEYKASPEDFKDYMCNSADFMKMESNLKYIESCIDETVESEINAHNYINGMVSGSAINANTVLAVLYSFMSRLHNKVSMSTFVEPSKGVVAVRTGNSEISSVIKESELVRRIEAQIKYLNRGVVPTSLSDIRNAIVFLEQIDLITITEPIYSVTSPNVKMADFLNGCDVGIYTANDLFKASNVCVKHPMFYFNMIKEVIPEIKNIGLALSNNVFGSALECTLRGLFSYKLGSDILYSYEYIDGDYQGEVDLIDLVQMNAYEFSVGTSHGIEHLLRLKNECNLFLISGEREHYKDNISYYYYPDFVLDMSRGDFVKHIPNFRW